MSLRGGGQKEIMATTPALLLGERPQLHCICQKQKLIFIHSLLGCTKIHRYQAPPPLELLSYSLGYPLTHYETKNDLNLQILLTPPVVLQACATTPFYG